ncbi:MAG: hypothetical protein H7642_07375, partial [Candidatus Heimdallarchaeota archaeon]|nr:hypothetical protein [Candidatus Heimdallarchaeota archaeon]
VDYWENIDDIRNNFLVEQEFKPELELGKRKKLKNNWKKAIDRAKDWGEI